MKAIVVLDEPPTAEGGAQGRCALGLLRGLASHGVDVRAVAARQWFSHPGDPPAGQPVQMIDVPAEPPSWAGKVRRWTQPRGELGRGPLAEAVRAAARGADVIHLEEIDTAWCANGTTAPAALHLHYLAHLDRPFGPPWRRPFREVLEFTLAERAAARRHRHLVASSPVVAAELARMAPGADIVLAPLSLDPNAYPAATLDGRPTAGIIGTASWAPTAAAIDRLVHHVWPLVRARVPDARLVIAGWGVDRRAPAVAGVESVGEAPSAAEFIRGLSVLLYPVPRGSGMKVKVLEAMASGVPVVTTPCGAEGVDGGDGVSVSEDDAALADAAAEVLRDPVARRQRGMAARAAFLTRYLPRPATAPLIDLYDRMSSRK